MAIFRGLIINCSGPLQQCKEKKTHLSKYLSGLWIACAASDELVLAHSRPHTSGASGAGECVIVPAVGLAHSRLLPLRPCRETAPSGPSRLIRPTPGDLRPLAAAS